MRFGPPRYSRRIVSDHSRLPCHCSAAPCRSALPRAGGRSGQRFCFGSASLVTNGHGAIHLSRFHPAEYPVDVWIVEPAIDDILVQHRRAGGCAVQGGDSLLGFAAQTSGASCDVPESLLQCPYPPLCGTRPILRSMPQARLVLRVTLRGTRTFFRGTRPILRAVRALLRLSGAILRNPQPSLGFLQLAGELVACLRIPKDHQRRPVPPPAAQIQRQHFAPQPDAPALALHCAAPDRRIGWKPLWRRRPFPAGRSQPACRPLPCNL